MRPLNTSSNLSNFNFTSLLAPVKCINALRKKNKLLRKDINKNIKFSKDRRVDYKILKWWLSIFSLR